MAKMKDIADVSFSGIPEALATGISKSVTEKLITRFMGQNGTYLSGAVKLGLGSILRPVLPKNMVGRSISNGLVIDGVEDIVNNLMTTIGPNIPFIGGNENVAEENSAMIL